MGRNLVHPGDFTGEIDHFTRRIRVYAWLQEPSEGFSAFFSVWIIFGYLGTFLVSFALFNRNGKQVLEIAGESLIVHGTGFWPGSKVRIRNQNLHALTLEHYDDTSRESVYTLNLLQKPGARPRRIMLASFVHPRDKAILLEEIRVFLDRHGFVFDVKNEMANMTDPENRTKD